LEASQLEVRRAEVRIIVLNIYLVRLSNGELVGYTRERRASVKTKLILLIACMVLIAVFTTIYSNGRDPA
jgi:hypothetical protein